MWQTHKSKWLLQRTTDRWEPGSHSSVLAPPPVWFQLLQHKALLLKCAVDQALCVTYLRNVLSLYRADSTDKDRDVAYKLQHGFPFSHCSGSTMWPTQGTKIRALRLSSFRYTVCYYWYIKFCGFQNVPTIHNLKRKKNTDGICIWAITSAECHNSQDVLYRMTKHQQKWTKKVKANPQQLNSSVISLISMTF